MNLFHLTNLTINRTVYNIHHYNTKQRVKLKHLIFNYYDPPLTYSVGVYINSSKTEEHEVKLNGDDEWKSCKLLESCLDTEKDIGRRHGLAIGAYKDMFFSEWAKSDSGIMQKITKMRINRAISPFYVQKLVFRCIFTYCIIPYRKHSEFWRRL